jgi:transcriptional regulator with XRE-family HTH domain
MANFLKKIREDKKIGQTELANRIGVTKQLLSGFENGRSGISNEVLIKLAEELQVSPDAILTGKSYKPLDQKNRQHLSEAMSMTFKNYGDEFDKDTIIKISTELYTLIVDFHELNNESDKQNFIKLLEEKIAVGLAAKCLLKNIK